MNFVEDVHLDELIHLTFDQRYYSWQIHVFKPVEFIIESAEKLILRSISDQMIKQLNKRHRHVLNWADNYNVARLKAAIKNGSARQLWNPQ